MFLDDDMFENVREGVENTVFMRAVENPEISTDVFDRLPPYIELKELETRLKSEGKLNFKTIFHELTGFVLFKQFLTSEYTGDKATFVSDCDAYRQIISEKARNRFARQIYDKFVALRHPGTYDFIAQPSVFEEANKRGSETKSAKAGSSSISKGPGSVSRSQSSDEPEDESERKEKPSPPITPLKETLQKDLESLRIGQVNPIGVYGLIVTRIEERISKGEYSSTLFDEAAECVLNDLKLDQFPRFLKSRYCENYIRTKWAETEKVTLEDFVTYRVLGRGAYGAVHACCKKNSGTLYALKCIDKRRLKAKNALKHIITERNILARIQSKFVTNLKYSLQDENTLYLVMDLMLGGDLKFHLVNVGHFNERRARFYAAEVLLGLEAIHKAGIIYRDLKLENVLLNRDGHCKVSDLGLAIFVDKKTRGYAGTPGYAAPEMVNGKDYGIAADVFSFGVFVYRMLCGSKPFKGKTDRELDFAVSSKAPAFPKEYFSRAATDLLRGLLEKDPENRLGCGKQGLLDIKLHPFFESIDWGLLEGGYVKPPFIPRNCVNAMKLKEIGDFNLEKYKDIKLDEKFLEDVKPFDYTPIISLQEEMTRVLEKLETEKVAPKEEPRTLPAVKSEESCCVIF